MQTPLLERRRAGVSLVNKEGNVSVHRRMPRLQKAMMTYLNSPFPAIIRLSWGRLIGLILTLYFVTIAIFSVWLNALDRGIQCVTNASTFADHFFFCCQCVLGLSFGYLSPICYSSNVLTTLMATVGTLQHTGVTGCVFAKFTLSRRRDLAVKFSNRLIGVKETGTAMVGLCFRFVNVLHKHVFKVKMQIHLIEHRHDVGAPLIEELKLFATSIPYEYMALPVEVVAYVDKDRLFNFQGGDITMHSAPYSPVNRKWLLYDTSKDSKRPLYEEHGGSAGPQIRPLANSSFELVCSLRFCDSTTGTAICARKSWSLAQAEWRDRGTWAWRNIVGVHDESQEIDVAISALDDIITQAATHHDDFEAFSMPHRPHSADSPFQL